MSPENVDKQTIEYTVELTGDEDLHNDFQATVEAKGGSVNSQQQIHEGIPDYLQYVLDEAQEYYDIEGDITETAYHVASDQGHLFRFTGSGHSPIEVLQDLNDLGELCDDDLDSYTKYLLTENPTVMERSQATISAIVQRSLEEMIFNRINE